MLYVVTQVDPIDRHSSVVGVFDSESTAEEARFQAMKLMSEIDIDAGIYFNITCFKMNQLYV